MLPALRRHERRRFGGVPARPGGLRELGVKSPLASCGLTKKEVKALAGKYGISAASRPSAPCMATRLPYGPGWTTIC